MQIVVEARARGVEVTCETCPHRLIVADEDAERLGTIGKCAPPLGPLAEVEGLRAELGSVDLLASGHSPSPAALKQGDDYFAIWGGISGCRSLLPNVLTEGLPLGLVTSRPAERFGLARKGRLEVGYDADIVLVEPGAEWELTAGELRYRQPHSPYVGRQFRGRITRTLVRRATGRGRFVRP